MGYINYTKQKPITMENIMMLHYTSKMRNMITQTYTKEQIIGAVQDAHTPCYTDAEYFIAYYAFEIIKRDILEQIRVVLDKLSRDQISKTTVINDTNDNNDDNHDDIENNIENNIVIIKKTCRDVNNKILQLASKIGTAHYEAFMLDSRDHAGGFASSKSKEIYKKFFEVKNEAIRCLSTMSDVKAQVKTMSSVNVSDDLTDCLITMSDIEACVEEIMNDLNVPNVSNVSNVLNVPNEP